MGRIGKNVEYLQNYNISVDNYQYFVMWATLRDAQTKNMYRQSRQITLSKILVGGFIVWGSVLRLNKCAAPAFNNASLKL